MARLGYGRYPWTAAHAVEQIATVKATRLHGPQSVDDGAVDAQLEAVTLHGAGEAFVS